MFCFEYISEILNTFGEEWYKSLNEFFYKDTIF